MILKAGFFFLKLGYPKILQVRDTQIEFRAFSKSSYLPLQLLGMPQVVGIKKSHEFTMGDTKPKVAHRRRAGIILSDVVDLVSVTSHHRRRSIGRAIVRNDDL